MKITIGDISIDSRQAQRYYRDGKYLVTYSRIFQLNSSVNVEGHIYGTCIYYKTGLLKRGTHKFMSAKEVNELLGFKYLME